MELQKRCKGQHYYSLQLYGNNWIECLIFAVSHLEPIRINLISYFTSANANVGLCSGLFRGYATIALLCVTFAFFQTMSRFDSCGSVCRETLWERRPYKCTEAATRSKCHMSQDVLSPSLSLGDQRFIKVAQPIAGNWFHFLMLTFQICGARKKKQIAYYRQMCVGIRGSNKSMVHFVITEQCIWYIWT